MTHSPSFFAKNSQTITTISGLILVVVLVTAVHFWAPNAEAPTTTNSQPAASKMAVGSQVNGDVSALTNHAWIWQGTITGKGANITPKKTGSFVINFATEGRMSASTDCNHVSGAYSVNGSSLVFNSVASTQMYCDGSQESLFTSELQDVNNYGIDANGKLIFILKGNEGAMMFAPQVSTAQQ
jgi:heat shock protein HslJ